MILDQRTALSTLTMSSAKTRQTQRVPSKAPTNAASGSKPASTAVSASTAVLHSPSGKAHPSYPRVPDQPARFPSGGRNEAGRGLSQWEILEWVYEVADHFGIRVRSEEQVLTMISPSLAPAAPTGVTVSPAVVPSTAAAEPPAAALAEKTSDAVSSAAAAEPAAC